LFHELNWIPIFGGGCSFQPSEILAMPLYRVELLIERIIDQREAEVKGFKG